MQSTSNRRARTFRSGWRWKQIVTITACGAAALTITGITGCGAQPGTAQPTSAVTTTISSQTAISPTPTAVIATPVPTPVPTPVAVPPASDVGGNAAPAPSDPYAAAKAAGASAVCADGTYSFSQHRSGTCSDHGGVHWWTGNLGSEGPGDH
jgi:Protein of unknown function (DUF3761)